MQMLVIFQRNETARVWSNKYYYTPFLGEKTMDNYILFENALQMLVNAFLASAMFMIAASGIGLAVIETLEKSSDR